VIGETMTNHAYGCVGDPDDNLDDEDADDY
jgi:hypothetical protein